MAERKTTNVEGAEPRLQVLLPLPFDAPLDYLPGGLMLGPGDIVRVPLGGREVTGVVWERLARRPNRCRHPA